MQGVAIDLLLAKPRSIVCIHEGPPRLIVTDSAFQDDIAHIGVLVMDVGSGKPLVFDGRICEDVCKVEIT